MIEIKSKSGDPYILRPLTKDDKINLVEGLKKMSSESIYNRFHGFKKEFNEKELTSLTDLDGVNRFAFAIIQVKENNELEGVGIARYHRTPESDRAEFAITLIDRVQGQGLAKVVILELIKVAKGHNIKFFDGTLENTNIKMINLIHKLDGFTTKRLSGNLLTMEGDLSSY
ncbi:GNAT family N-acetyltransferase [Halobacteriovorax sp.]|uniref:GNAT family N-acetyltransferase n=1 Tax=Halobacteriovorax sp. TaxID=2020862 RepID=UPI0035645779